MELVKWSLSSPLLNIKIPNTIVGVGSLLFRLMWHRHDLILAHIHLCPIHPQSAHLVQYVN